MLSAGLGAEWMEVDDCFSALTGVVVLGGDWTTVVIDLESTNDGGGCHRGGAKCQGGTVTFREGN